MTQNGKQKAGNGQRTTEKWLLVGLLLAAFALRAWQLDGVPPGWRDDELINSLVISQKVLDGDLAVYYADASGHEALYHALNAVMLSLFGRNIVGIRLLSGFLGLLTVALTYTVGRRLWNPRLGWLAAALLAVSFWGLMYSRFGLRHVLTPPLMLGAVYFFMRGLNIGVSRMTNDGLRITDFLAAAVFMALGFYTYFASRGVPLIFAAFVGYLALVDWPRVRRHWRGMAAMVALAALLAVPLLVTLNQQPESEARVAELAVPLTALRAGDWQPLWEYTTITLSMFHSRGDDEWLYNVPERPLFNPVGAAVFWLGVGIAVWWALQPIWKRKTKNGARDKQYGAAFLIAWWLAGISPGFISVPPASLGHTILAQPAVYLLAALPVVALGERLTVFSQRRSWWIGLAILMVGIVAVRDWQDYFVTWPQRGMVRFLYRADIHDVADYVNDQPDLTDFGMTGLLAGPWDRVAFEMDVQRSDVRARWYNPQRALLIRPSLSFSGYPEVSAMYADAFTPLPDGAAGGYTLAQTTMSLDGAGDLTARTCFDNGLCVIFADYDPDVESFDLGWQVQGPLELPEIPLISNPPPPGVYSGPRLLVFAQLLDDVGQFMVGDDGLWVDPGTLQAGDQFLQRHWLPGGRSGSPQAIVFGLYDPLTGARILTETGADHVRLEIAP